MDTSRLLFICAGAFVGLDGIVERRLGNRRQQIGFRARPAEAVEALSDRPVYTALCQAQTRDLVDFGMIPEFVGRFATVTVLHELSRQDLGDILNAGLERSPLTKQQRLAALHGIKLEIAPDALDDIAEEAMVLGTGARGLHRLIGRAVDPVDHQWPELADRGIRKVVITRNCLRNGAPPDLISGPPSIPRVDQEPRRQSLAGLPPQPQPMLATGTQGASLPGGLQDTRKWSSEQIWNALELVKAEHLGWKDATGGARKWWETFEIENRHRPALVYRLAEELRNRKATLNEFFAAFVFSNTSNIQANLHFLDYKRLKDQGDKDK